jgi:hypothetical protein
MIKGDAPDIQHDECIWNSAIAISERVDKYSEQATKKGSASDSAPPPPLSKEILESVEALRIFRHVCREISLSFGRHGESDSRGSSFFAERLQDSQDWKKMVDDIDRTLHHFKYRNVSPMPRFQAKRVKKAGSVDEPKDEGLATGVTTKDNNVHVQAKFATQFQEKFLALPDLQPYEVCMFISDFVQLVKNDEILIRFHGKKVTGCIVKVVDQMEASLVSYQGLSHCHDEYQPKNLLPISNAVHSTDNVDGGAECSKIDYTVKQHSGNAEVSGHFR